LKKNGGQKDKKSRRRAGRGRRKNSKNSIHIARFGKISAKVVGRRKDSQKADKKVKLFEH